MTEPDVALSDATNIRTEIRRDGDYYIIKGRKWWTSGAGDPRCKLLITMGLTDSDGSDRHQRHSMILVPADAPGVTVRRYLPVLGFSEAPHGHMETIFDDVRVPATNLLLGDGRGFEIAQGRLGPGRIHHSMRMIGVCERALERMCRRLSERIAFGKPIAEQSVSAERIADARCAIEQARLLTLNAAWKMDRVGNKAAKAEIAMIKIVVPSVTGSIVDLAIQAFGAGGVADTVLSQAYIYARAGRIVDGPDEVTSCAVGTPGAQETSRHRHRESRRFSGRHHYSGRGPSTGEPPWYILWRYRLKPNVTERDRWGHGRPSTAHSGAIAPT